MIYVLSIQECEYGGSKKTTVVFLKCVKVVKLLALKLIASCFLHFVMFFLM